MGEVDTHLSGTRTMATLIVRGLEPRLVEALKQRAASHGRSAEAEHRAPLEAALSRPRPRPRPFAAVLASMPDVGEDADFAREEGEAVADVFD